MNIADFRHGNIINLNWVDKEGEPQSTIRIYGTLGNYIYVDSNRLPKYEEIHIEDVNPLKSSGEWLVRLGFVYQEVNIKRKDKFKERIYHSPYFGNSEYWLEYMLPVHPFNHPFLWLCWDKGNGRQYVPYPNGDKIEYIHQIQNVFLDLARDELKVKMIEIKVDSK